MTTGPSQDTTTYPEGGTSRKLTRPESPNRPTERAGRMRGRTQHHRTTTGKRGSRRMLFVFAVGSGSYCHDWASHCSVFGSSPPKTPNAATLRVGLECLVLSLGRCKEPSYIMQLIKAGFCEQSFQRNTEGPLLGVQKSQCAKKRLQLWYFCLYGSSWGRILDEEAVMRNFKQT